MTQKWRKLGMIFCPNGEREWMHSHASVPIAEHIGDDLFKIYFASRNRQNESYTGYLIVDLNRQSSILELSREPILRPGRLGEFDDSGAMATWLTNYNDQKFLYYIGWNLGVTVPFRNSIGLAISSDGNEFNRISSGPILDRSLTEPHFVASCCVLPDVDKWRMWYLSCTGWQSHMGKAQHRYHIKYAESSDGVFWTRNGLVAIDYANDAEYAISRPSVMREKDRWRMWYSYRGDRYRIGYAESQDGKVWVRLDNLVQLRPSVSGWDSEMIEYPYVFEHRGALYILYNGNGYGKTGFGIAILENS